MVISRSENITIFHVHTYRCLHAGDEREIEYIQKAIELGATEIVFTDHCPFPGNPFRMRMEISELADYVNTLKALRQQFKDKIDIKIGLETEYVPTYREFYEQLRDSGEFDLLLLGQHFALLPDGEYTFQKKDKSGEAKALADAMIEGMQSGFFSVVAHPDQIFRREGKWNEEMARISNRIKQCAAQTGVTLEINMDNKLNNERGRKYRKEFWEDMPKDINVIYGVDAHSVAELEKHYKEILRILQLPLG